MAESSIIRTEQSGIARLTLNRPTRRNALTRELLKELKDHLTELVARTDLRLIVLGAQGVAFCAGMDLVQMEETAALPGAAAIWQADTEVYRDVVRLLFEATCPTLAVVPGPAVAGGLGLMLACDLVLAAETASFALPEPKRGITAAVVTPLLVHRVGPSAASFLLLSGATIDARRGRELGLCHEVVAGDKLVAATSERERSILSGAPGALALSKRQLRDCTAVDVSEQLERAALVSARARATLEAREGLQAFLEKRPPRWTNSSSGTP